MLTYRNWEDVNIPLIVSPTLVLPAWNMGFPLESCVFPVKNLIKQNTNYSQYKVAVQNTKNLEQTAKGSTVSLT